MKETIMVHKSLTRKLTAFLDQEKEFRGGNMSLVMHTHKTKHKKVDDFMSEVWKMPYCHLLICRMLPFLTQEALEGTGEILKIYSIR